VPEPGELFGPYRLISQLGKGAMGEVWRARDERLDRFVALKVLPAELAGDAERRARMVREAKAAAAIRHPNVVTLFDIANHHGDDLLVMELVEGRTLSDILRNDGPPPLETALRWLEAIADGLVAAHARGILHRDLKSANVMITSAGDVKVLDFGLAKLRDDAPGAPGSSAALSLTTMKKVALDETMASEHRATGATSSDGYATRVGSLLGTPQYMSPEQVAGNAPDERSEVFSLGVLAYELIAGQPPYRATAVDELFRQIAEDAPPPLRAPEPVSGVVVRALAKDPAQRFPTMQALRGALADVRRRVFAPRARRWPWFAAGVALLVLAVGAWWLFAHRPAADRPGDEYVHRALDEYDVFYQEKALSSLRAALAVAPDHPRANAYMLLFGGASSDDRDAALTAAKRARPASREHGKDRVLLDAAIATVDQGVAAARAALTAADPDDRELAFWAAELDFRAGHYAVARDEYRALLTDPAPEFRGRIFDHQSSVLLYFDEPTEALAIGKAYRDAFPGEADAVGVRDHARGGRAIR
jgi:tRNA A-37 threonylcarbamoyl transferase component Bud32